MPDFQTTQLDNGLTIVAETDDAAHTGAVGFFVKAGSRDETDNVMGVSHFLEHMMFKGTERRTAADVNREFDEIGANYNASTSQEVTTYYAHVLPEFIPQSIDLLSDMLRPSLRDDDFNMEKNVILEEIGMYEDHLFWVAYEKAMADSYPDHPLGYRVLGTKDTIKALTADQMRAYFEHRYSPDNIVVSLGGKIDFDACVDQIAEACGGWKRTGVTRDYAEPRVAESAATIAKPTAALHYVIGLTDGPSAQDESRYAADALAHILGDSDGSRLYWKLIDTGLADEAEVSHHGYDQTGMYLLHAACPPENADKVEAALLETVDAAANDLTDDEIERAKSKMMMAVTLRDERPAGRMMSAGSNWLYLGKHLTLEDQLTHIRAIDADAIRGVIERHPFTPRTIARLTPNGA